MKKLILTALPVAVIVLLTAFDWEPDWQSASGYAPVLMRKDDLRNSIIWQEARDFQRPGKIYIYGSTIFIVDVYKGIHLINNTDRTNPQKSGFILIPGVLDLAVRDSVIYADNAIDLVAIDIRALPQISILDRVEEVFPEPVAPDMMWWWGFRKPEGTVVVGWNKKSGRP
ncbi:MAG TPA: hypothetical protein PKE03_02575 [Bacteroidales bacterium]|nr:hypothetical protein [Bacteroidales bacterium]